MNCWESPFSASTPPKTDDLEGTIEAQAPKLRAIAIQMIDFEREDKDITVASCVVIFAYATHQNKLCDYTSLCFD
jgi:hypothetical protein